tara:strand:+ start:3278 stop:4054 length:777 start_codon:yes stop_codon:yes gene_type:complete
VDLEVEAGSILSIIGPNGSGKTTFFNCLSGLYQPDAGEIILLQQDRERSLIGLRPDEVCRAGLSRTFQTIRLFPNMSVLDNVLVGMHPTLEASTAAATVRNRAFLREEQDAAKRAHELLGFFRGHLKDRAAQPACSLSYANQRRLEIVRAMASNAAVLLLDEPAAGMNPSETEELIQDIVRLKELGRTVLLIEHDMVVIATISDRVVALEGGHKIAEGSFEQVRRSPRVVEAYLGRGAAGRAGDSHQGPGSKERQDAP